MSNNNGVKMIEDPVTFIKLTIIGTMIANQVQDHIKYNPEVSLQAMKGYIEEAEFIGDLYVEALKDE